MADKEKRGKVGNTKNWISHEQKDFLDETKSIIHSFCGAIIWWYNKKIADTSFNKTFFCKVLTRYIIDIIYMWI